MNEGELKKLMGSRILSEANDLKRTPEALADELGIDEEKLTRILKGEGALSEIHEIIEKMGEITNLQGISVPPSVQSVISLRLITQVSPTFLILLYVSLKR